MFPRNKTFPWIGLGLCLPALLPVILLCAHLASEVWIALSIYGFGHLRVWDWNPDASRYGLLPLISGSLAASTWAMALWFPLGLGTACWLGIFASSRLRRLVELALGMLASVPTTVAGLLVLSWVVPFTNFGLAPAAAVLALLNLPLFAAGAAAALRQRAVELRQAAEALGLHGGAVGRLIVMKAWRGVLGAALAAFARSSGEALAIKLVADNEPSNSWWLTGSVKTLGSTLAMDHGGVSGEHAAMLGVIQMAMVGLAVTLSCIVRKIESRP